MTQQRMEGVQALLFDVFGTLVNWRKSVTNHLINASHAALNSPEASIPSAVRLVAAGVNDARWADFAQEWRNKYFKFTRSYNPEAEGGRFIPIDDFFAGSLKELLEEWNLVGLWDDEQVIRVSRIWHRLEPYPDTAAGLAHLRPMFARLSTLSNGSTALLTDLMAFAQPSMTDLLCAEDFGAYKPHPRVYDGAAARLNLPTSQCAMVAAHLADLDAARGRGMKTIYIERCDEESWSADQVSNAKREGWVDHWIKLQDGNGDAAGIGAAFITGESRTELNITSSAQAAVMSGTIAAAVADNLVPGADGGLVELSRRLREEEAH